MRTINIELFKFAELDDDGLSIAVARCDYLARPKNDPFIHPGRICLYRLLRGA